MIKPAVLDAMVAAGCTGEQIAAAVKADQAASSGASRQARYRARKALKGDDSDVTSVTGDGSDVTGLPPKETSPEPPKEITPNPVSEPRGSSTESAREFASFWRLYPNKVGKPAAQASFVKARKKAGFEAIMAGLQRYVDKADDRAWCNPQTWLNQERWDDQPALALLRSGAGPPASEPRTVSELAIHRLQTGRPRDEPTGYANGSVDPGVGRGQVESPRGAHILALAAKSVGRIE